MSTPNIFAVHMAARPTVRTAVASAADLYRAYADWSSGAQPERPPETRQ